MKPKTTIILAALLLACIVLALFTGDLFTPSKPQDKKAEAKELFDPKPGKCVRLTIEGKGRKFVFEKLQDAWRLVEPIQAKAESWRVNDVVDAVKDVKGRPAEGVADETAGLVQPVWTITYVDDQKRTHRLLVGNPRPMERDETYVRPAGSKQTFIAEVDLKHKVDKPLGDFRDDTVLDLKTDDVARLEVEGPQSFELVRREGKWGIVAPISAEADADKVKDLLDDACRVTASEFVADAPADLTPYGLDRPRVVVRVEMKPEEPQTQPTTASTQEAPRKHGLAIGRKVRDKMYAKLLDEPGVFKVNESLLDELQPKLIDLRVKKVMRLQADEVAAVEIDVPAGKAALSKTDGQWQMAAPLKGKADQDRLRDLLDGVAGLAAESFNDSVAALGVYGLDKPTATLTFRLAGKDEAATLLVGGRSPSGEMTFVKPASGVAVAVVKTADVKKLLSEPATYWDRTLLKLPGEAKVTRLQLRRTDGTFTLVGDANEDWSLTTPLEAPAEKDHVNKVIDHLEELKADKIVYLGRQVPDDYAKATSIMQVAFTSKYTPPAPQEPATQATQPTQPTQVTQPAATAPSTTKPAATRSAVEPVIEKHLVTVARLGLHSYAWVAGREIVAVGEFAPSLYDDLAGEMRGRKVWTFEPDDVGGIRLVAGEDSIDLRKDGEAWTYTPDPYVKIDADKVKDFLKDLKDLKAEKFATHAEPKQLADYKLDKPWLTLELTDAGGQKKVLVVSHEGATKTEDRYARASGVPGVFVLASSSIEKLGKKLDDFKKP